LARIVGGSLLAGVGVEQVDVEGVVLVDEVEDIRGDLEGEAVSEWDGAGNTEIGENGIRAIPVLRASEPL